MTDTDATVALLAEWLTKLIGPAVLLLVACAMLVSNNIIRATPNQETNLAAGAMAVLALGRGFDKIDKLRGRD